MSTSVSWEEANHRRLERHGLVKPLASLGEAASAMTGAHAQVMSAAEVSLALRVAGATRADVATALWEERSLVMLFRGPRRIERRRSAAGEARDSVGW